MTYLELSDNQAWSLINALHTAADSYQRYATMAREGEFEHGITGDAERLAAQFELQAETALGLAALVGKS